VNRSQGCGGNFDPDDIHSRYIEASIGELSIGCLYLPNGNPAPGPEFDYKLAWFKRLQAYERQVLAQRRPFVLAGDFNVMPTELEVYPRGTLSLSTSL
jgi:exodeoxyribonuclease III